MNKRSRIIMAAGALLLAGFAGFLWVGSAEPPPAASGPNLSNNGEVWAETAGAADSGILGQADGDDLPRQVVVDSSLRLSSVGRSMLHDSLERKSAKLLAEIERELSGSEASVEAYRRTLQILVDYELHRAMQELLRKDAFQILRNGEFNPPATPGVQQVSIAPFETSDGEFGRVLFLIGTEARRSLSVAEHALIGGMRQDRSPLVLFWNGQPEEVRKAWVEEHLALQARVEASGLADLTPDELRRFVDQRTELRYLEVRLSTVGWSFIPK